LLISGSLQIVVEKQGSETITGQIAKTLEHAASFKHKVQSRGEYLVEQGAFYTLIASSLTLPFFGLNKAVAISYSGFGYQMRMSAPLIVLNYLRIASRNGILVKDGRALDTLHVIDTIIFDKTGTLTEEVPKIERLIACNGFTEQQLLQYAASAEQRQKHPIAQAIINNAQQQEIPLFTLIHNEYAIGHGLQAKLFEPTKQRYINIKVGSQRFIQSINIEVPNNITQMQHEAGEKGYSVVYVASEQGQLIGAIELRPALRSQAKEAIAALHKLGIKVYIISGDQEKPTRHLAQSLGIDAYFAETLPQDKAKHVEELQAQGRKVCFVGDGINDSVALQKADVSVSLHGAATIAQDTADIVLMTQDLSHIPYLINISKELDQRMTLSEQLNMGSGVACVSGVFLLGMGTGGAITLFSAGLLVNLMNSLLPLLVHPERSKLSHQVNPSIQEHSHE
jgi:Cu2+-exporting ATPase